MSEVSGGRILGIAASPGVGLGTAFVVDRRRVSVPRRHLEVGETEAEVQRLRAAMAAARAQLAAVRDRLGPEAGDHSLILDAHLLMLDDALLTEQTERAIRAERLQHPIGAIEKFSHPHVDAHREARHPPRVCPERERVRDERRRQVVDAVEGQVFKHMQRRRATSARHARHHHDPTLGQRLCHHAPPAPSLPSPSP